MRNKLLLLLFCFAMTGHSIGATIAGDFFRNPNMSSPIINISGDLLLLTKKIEHSNSLVVHNLNTKQEAVAHRTSSSSGYHITNLQWLDKNTFSFILYHSHRGTELIIYDVNEQMEITEVTTFENTFVFSTQVKSADTFIAKRYKYDKPHLFRIDLRKENLLVQFQSKKRISKGPLEDGEWLINSNGKVNVNYGIEDDNNKIYVRFGKPKKWRLVWDEDSSSTFIPVLFKEKEGELIVLSNKDTGYMSLYSFDVEKKVFNKIIHQVKGKDIYSILTNRYENEIIGFTYLQGGIIKQVYSNPLADFLGSEQSKSVQPNGYVVDHSEDNHFIIYFTGSIDNPATFYVFDNKTKESLLIGEERPWLNEYKLGKSEVIHSVSTDGLAIESYLTVPTHLTDQKFPLLVMPHGGPLGIHDTRHFSTDVHYFVQKGYAVLTPNYRGSSGYGKDFLNSGKQQWGRLIEDDIESAVAETIKSDLIDGQKICIFGISYGGYSALISAIRRPDLYKCAISYAGVTDIPLLFSQSQAASESSNRRMLIDILGNPDESFDTLVKYSPVYQLKDLSVPLMIGQGGQDRIVDDEHYFRLLYMLRKLKKKYKKLYFKNEIHGFKLIDSQIKFFNKVDNFMREHLVIIDK